MKKRVLALLLAFLMVLPICLTGCGDDDDAQSDIADSDSEDARTLVMYVMAEEGIDKEEAQLVSEAMSEITENKYKTKLIVEFYTPDEYYSKLESQLAIMEEKYLNDEMWYDLEDEDTEEETYRDEYSIIRTKYPDAADYQVDIFYVGGFDKLMEYVNKQYTMQENDGSYTLTEYNGNDEDLYETSLVKELNSELSGSSSLISHYVPTVLLDAAKIGNVNYSVPNNNTIGEYTYVVINKEVAQKYFHTTSYDSFKDLSSQTVQFYLNDLASDASFSSLVPIDNTFEEWLNLIAYYWNIDPTTLDYTNDEFSLIGSYIINDEEMVRGESFPAFKSLLEDSDYQTALKALLSYNVNGYFGTAAEGQDFGLKVVKGDASIPSQYDSEKYEVIVMHNPQVSMDDAFGNMFCVANRSESVSRDMEIITLLNTDAEFRNLLQYGIEGRHYKLDLDGNVVRLSDDYKMDIAKTGNMFLAYPDVDAGYSSDDWYWGKIQNQDAYIPLTLTFTFAEAQKYVTRKLPLISSTSSTNQVQKVKELSAEVLTKLKNCTSLDDYDTWYADLISTYGQYTESTKSVWFMCLSSSMLKSNTKATNECPYFLFYSWAKVKNYLPDYMKPKEDEEEEEDDK